MNKILFLCITCLLTCIPTSGKVNSSQTDDKQIVVWLSSGENVSFLASQRPGGFSINYNGEDIFVSEADLKRMTPYGYQTIDIKETPSQAVDLGLPSKILWAYFASFGYWEPLNTSLADHCEGYPVRAVVNK